MAAGYDGSIRIDTKIDSSGINRGAKSINSGINSITGSLRKLTAAVGIAFGISTIVNFGNASVKAAASMENAFIGLQSIIEGQGRSFQESKGFLEEYISDGLVPATNAATAYKNLALRGYDTSQIEDVMTAFKNSAAYGRQSSYTIGEAISSASEGLKNENSILVDNVGVTKNVAKMWEDYAKSIGTTANKLTQQQKIQAEVNGILKETKFQMGDAEKASGTYSGQVARLSQNFLSFKAAIGKGLIAVLTPLIGLLNTIMRHLISFANTFSAVMQSLFGITQQGALDAATSVSDVTAATEGLTEATLNTSEAVNNSTAGFDELNQLSGGSGGKDSGKVFAPDTSASGGFKAPIDTSNVQAATLDVQRYFKNMADAVTGYYNVNLAGVVNGVISKIKNQVAVLAQTFKRMWKDIVMLGSPLKGWFSRDFTTFLQTFFGVAGNILSGFLDTANLIFSGLWNEVVFPNLELFVTEGLPFVTQFATESLNALNALFSSVKIIFDTFWKGAMLPFTSLVSGIVRDLWIGIFGAWKKWGAPLFDLIKQTIRNITETWLNCWNSFIKPVFDAAMEVITRLWKKHLNPLWDNILDFIGSVIECALTFYNKFILPIVNWLVKTLGPVFSNVFGAIFRVVGSVIGGIIDAISGFITICKGIIKFLTGVFAGDWEKAWSGIVDIFKGLFEGIAGIVKGVINAVISVINGMINGVTIGINFVIGCLNKLSFTVPDWVPLIGGSEWGFNIDTFDAPKIPYLATGAVIPPNSKFLAVLGDQKSGKNIEAPEGLLRQLIEEEVSKIGNRGAEVTIKFAGSLAQLGRVLKPVIDDESRRAGVKLIVEGGTD